MPNEFSSNILPSGRKTCRPVYSFSRMTRRNNPLNQEISMSDKEIYRATQKANSSNEKPSR